MERKGSKADSMISQNNLRLSGQIAPLWLRLTINSSNVFTETQVYQERERLQQALTLKKETMKKGQPFMKPWYCTDRKFLKKKLGQLCYYKT